ncbi:hypothetical protein, partial [Kitasatospora sp. NPDC057541]|uniref:hypothetical protein n=1 Tax=Kitasatospora sp. NPDC057541 TaxID=3346161 RepID=UPI0036B9CEBF
PYRRRAVGDAVHELRRERIGAVTALMAALAAQPPLWSPPPDTRPEQLGPARVLTLRTTAPRPPASQAREAGRRGARRARPSTTG